MTMKAFAQIHLVCLFLDQSIMIQSSLVCSIAMHSASLNSVWELLYKNRAMVCSHNTIASLGLRRPLRTQDLKSNMAQSKLFTRLSQIVVPSDLAE